MRKIVAALQVTLDGLIEGPLDWVANWGDQFGLTSEVDACLLGGGMYGGYERYWTSILADPRGVLDFTGRKPTSEEIDYAAYADRTPHYVLSRTLQQTSWHVATILRDLKEVDALKRLPGRAIHALGGAGLVSSLMNAGLVDELRLIVNPIVLGRGKRLFGELSGPHRLRLLGSEAGAGQVKLVYGLP
jgi:dihydrofolate reductase